VLALRAAGDAARGATAYVTLEPHCFHGKTPPCTDALILAGIARVVCGVLDPNPKVHGQGMRQLQEAGIVCDVGLLAEEARALNLGFEKRMRTGLPRVVVKVAATLDGRVALANGASRWVTSEAARADVQRLRAAASAVLTGVQTIVADDPQLNVRDPEIDMAGRLPLRVILDTHLRVDATARLFTVPGPVLIATCSEDANRSAVLGSRGAEIMRVAADSTGRVDIARVLQELGHRECNEVLVEAGPALSGRLVSLDLCDELIVYFAPKLFGADAKPMFQLPEIRSVRDSLQFELRETEPVGPDLRLTLVRAKPMPI
jgi:diaminohydroxyphosphoribosylaminopyrimidine deaminase/5-amino-6-(5-phosphoribosylamino)uracil reductase